MKLSQLLVSRYEARLNEKRAFQPMPGGQPPADPTAQPPMDPSMMGGAPGGAPGASPMDPSMMGGAPGGMPMDPSMMGGMMPPAGPPPATIGQLSVTDFQTIMTDMLSNVVAQILGGAGSAPESAGAPEETAPQEDKRTVSNTEINDKLDALMAMLGSVPPGPAAPGPEASAPGADMGFGGQSAAMPAQPMPGMEVQASTRTKKASLADMIIGRTSKARR